MKTIIAIKIATMSKNHKVMTGLIVKANDRAKNDDRRPQKETKKLIDARLNLIGVLSSVELPS